MNTYTRLLIQGMTLLPLLVIFALPFTTFAATINYEPLVVIPGLTDKAGSGNLSTYVKYAYAFSISIAALLAVIKIIIAGVKWMMTDKIGSISEAKSDIQSALLGLIIIICAVLIINIINPTFLS